MKDAQKDAQWVGIDVGGTKVLAGLVSSEGRVLRTARRSSGGLGVSVAALEQTMTEVLSEVSEGVRPAAVGVAAAGFVDAAGERVVFAPHLPWRDDPVRARLESRWGVPVALENDATCALWAEVENGALVGCDSGLLVALGTGIGGGILAGGRVLRGVNGMAGEFGHMQVVPGGYDCPCGLQGCWEQYASGTALVRAARDLGARRGGDGGEAIDGSGVTRAAAIGEPDAVAAFDEVGWWLGVGTANLVAALDPQRVVVGGGVATAGALLLDPARESLRQHLVGAPHRLVPEMVAAVHGEHAGLLGAAFLARDLIES